jgi:hypothetical protein
MTSVCNQSVTVIDNTDCCAPTNRGKNTYSVTLTVADIWIMPALTDTTCLRIPNCNNVLTGSWLWNKSVGYLEVVKYNHANGETIVKNIGYDGNAVEGTVFPSCMDFVVTAPIHLESIDDNVTCLSADFISPAVNECALMVVKSTANLKAGYIIAIEIYQYKVAEVISNTVVQVCNYGFGKDGTIEAGCDGTCNPIRVINANDPCLNETSNVANSIVTCVGGESRLFVGNEDGQVAVWDNSSGEWKLQNSNLVSDCTVISTYTNLIAGNPGPYLLNVSDTSPFTVGADAIFDGRSCEVTEIISSSQLRVTLVTAPDNDFTVLEGARLCLLDCCSWLPQALEELEDRVTIVEVTSSEHAGQIADLQDTVGDILNNLPDTMHQADLVSNTAVLTVNYGVNSVLGLNDTELTLDTDLSQYDNTQKNFVVNATDVSTATGVPILSGSSVDATTGDKTLTFKKIKSGDTSKLTVTENAGDIVLTNIAQSGGADITVLNTAVTDATTYTLDHTGNTATVTPSVTIPTSHAGAVNIIGSVAVSISGSAYNDTHYAHAYTGSTPPTNFSGYSFVANATNCNIQITGGVNVGGSSVVSGVVSKESYFFIPNPNGNVPNPTATSMGFFTRTMTIPFALTLTSLPTSTNVDIPLVLECPNASAIGGGNDEAIWAKVTSITANVSALVFKM